MSLGERLAPKHETTFYYQVKARDQVMLPYERTQEFQSRKDICELLSTASAYREDEFGNAFYTFGNSVASAELCIKYGMDVHVTLNITTQAEPIARAELECCEEFRVVNDKRGHWIEFIGDIVSSNQGHYHLALKSGFRITLEPCISLNLFFSPVEESLQKECEN